MLACLVAVIAVSLSAREDEASNNGCGLGGCEEGVEEVEGVEGVDDLEDGCASGGCVEGVEKRRNLKKKPGQNKKKPGQGRRKHVGNTKPGQNKKKPGRE